MLDEAEFARVAELMSQAARATKAFRKEQGRAFRDSRLGERFRPALELYERMTGVRETNPNAIWHHRLAAYGPSCTLCERPLRTPQARHCAACGAPRSEAR